MSEIVPFNFDGNQVRVIVDLEGNPWWVAADVCDALGLADVSDAVGRIEDADRGTAPIRSGGQNRWMLTVNESGLWDLVLDSRKPEAKRFRRWITSEVIPSIHRTGSYSAVPASFAEALELAAAQQREIEAAQAQLAIAAPKAEFHDRFMENEGLISMTDLADMFGTSVNKFTGWLADLGVFRKGEYEPFPGRRMPRKAYLDSGYFQVKIEVSPKNRSISYPVAYATPSGMDFVREVLRQNGLVD